MGSAINVRECFLNDVASLLSVPSPSSADHLRQDATVIRALRDDSSQPSHSDSCPVCGSSDIELQHREVGSQPRGSSAGDPITEMTVRTQILHIRKCRQCSRSVKRIVTKVIADIKQTDEASTERGISWTTSEPSSASQLPSAKSSSKKRAKERKDREGLKAMMSKSKDNSKSSASGFSLMDFMSRSGH